MFDIKKFGAYMSRLRKNADMTQSKLADKLHLTRQAISKYERGHSFPDISILISITEIFKITLDVLINAGEPTKGEAKILETIAKKEEKKFTGTVSDVVNLAPLLKPSVLDKMAEGLLKQGIDITSVVSLAEYMNDKSVLKLLQTATFDTPDEELLEKLIPFLDERSKGVVFGKILTGEFDWHMIKILLPYAEYISTQIEAAVIEGALPYEALMVMREGQVEIYRKNNSERDYKK